MNLNPTPEANWELHLTKRSLENKQHTVCNWGQPQRLGSILWVTNTQVKINKGFPNTASLRVRGRIFTCLPWLASVMLTTGVLGGSFF